MADLGNQPIRVAPDTAALPAGVVAHARWIERLPLLRGHPLLATAVMLALVLLAFGLRVVAHSLLPPGFPYVTFFPAVIITSFLLGVRLGTISAVLCGLMAWYFFIGPPNQFDLSPATTIALAFYIFVVVTDLALVHWMQTANRQLVAERELSRSLAAAKARMVDELEYRIVEGRRVADALLESEMKTQLAIQMAGIGLWQWQPATGELQWDRTMFDLYGLPPTPDGRLHHRDFIASIHPDDLPARDLPSTNIEPRHQPRWREFRIRRRDNGEIRHIRAVEVTRNGVDGRADWVVGTNLDITEQKNRDAHVQLLMGEINHRAKNMLGVVMAVAQRTGGSDHGEFMQRFAARIQSLAAGQDLLVQSQWRGVQLDALARAQLDHFSSLIGDRITLAGPPVPLCPPAVQTIGMALHELATNASKYGALSNDGGRVAVVWQTIEVDGQDRFVMTWTETGGPPVAVPTRRGFGTTVTDKMVRMAVDGDVTIDFLPAGLVWRLDCPAANVVEARLPGEDAEERA